MRKRKNGMPVSNVFSFKTQIFWWIHQILAQEHSEYFPKKTWEWLSLSVWSKIVENIYKYRWMLRTFQFILTSFSLSGIREKWLNFNKKTLEYWFVNQLRVKFTGFELVKSLSLLRDLFVNGLPYFENYRFIGNFFFEKIYCSSGAQTVVFILKNMFFRNILLY